MKKITLDLVGLDGNAFSLLGHFRKQAKKEGWSAEEIKQVILDLYCEPVSETPCRARQQKP